MTEAEFEALKLGETRVRFRLGKQEYVVMVPLDVLGFTVIQQVTGNQKGKYYRTKLDALTLVPVPFPTGYQLVYPTRLGVLRQSVKGVTQSLKLRPSMTPIAVKKHNADGSTTVIPWADWGEVAKELEAKEAWEEYYSDSPG